MPETETPTPETFNLDDWLNDANLPEESCRVYKRGDVISELSSLREQIEDQEAALTLTQTDREKLLDLWERYEELLTVFGDSAITVYVQAVPRSKLREIKKQMEKREKAEEWDRQRGNEEFGYATIAESIVGLQEPGKDRFAVRFSAKDARLLEDKIGSGQFGAIMQAKTRADSAIKEPDADFLRKRSGDSKDDIDV